MLNSKKCSLLINTCDNYEDTWIPFFSLLSNYWGECPYSIYLNTEEKNISYNNLDIEVINHSKNMQWSDRLIDSLKKIKTKYVILMLDYFFINADVNQDKLDQCINWMDQNPDVAVFSFASSLWKDIDDNKYEGFVLRPTEGEYRFNLQTALWRKKQLIKILRKGESPWQTEHMGTFRSRVLYSNKKFYASEKGIPMIIPYEYGGAIHQGKWTKGTPELLKKNNISTIDYSIRGFDPKSTEEWSKLHLDEVPVITKKSLKMKIGEYLVALGIIKARK